MRYLLKSLLLVTFVFANISIAKSSDHRLDTLFYDTFQNDLDSWTTLGINPGCATFAWELNDSLYSVAPNAIRSESENPDCEFHIQTSSAIQIDKFDIADSVKIFFDMFRSSRFAESDDLLNLNLNEFNGDESIVPHYSIYRHASKPPFATPGWRTYQWKVPFSALATEIDTNDYGDPVATEYYDQLTLALTAFSDTIYGDEPIYVDNIRIYTYSGRNIDIIQPSGGERMTPGDDFLIQWESEHVQEIDIEYSIDGGVSWDTIATNYNAYEESYEWEVPEEETDFGKIRILDATEEEVYGISRGHFFISESPPSISLRSPTGGETLQGNSEFEITWESHAVSDVNVEYSVDGGIDFTEIATDIDANDESYMWTVANVDTDEGVVRVTDADDHNIFGQVTEFITIESVEGNSIESSIEEHINVYPNPSNDGQFTFEFDGVVDKKSQIAIYDLYGREVLTEKLPVSSNEMSFQIDEKGMYFLQYRNSNEAVYEKKLIVR